MMCLQKIPMMNLTNEHDIVYVSFGCDWLTHFLMVDILLPTMHTVFMTQMKKITWSGVI